MYDGWNILLVVIVSADVEKHARNFMEAAKKLQQYFICLQRENKPTKAETLERVKSTRHYYRVYIYFLLYALQSLMGVNWLSFSSF